VSVLYPNTVPAYAGFDALLPRIYAGAPGVPETAAEHYVRDAAIRFCEESGWLQRDTRFPTGCWLCVSPLLPTDCERVMRVQRVWFGHRRFNDTQDDGIPFAVDAIDTPDAAVVLETEPDGCEPLNVRYIAVPVHDACVIDARLIEEWGQTLAGGALSTLAMLPDQPFSNPAMAAVYARQFEDDVRRARVRRITGRKGGLGGVQSMTTGGPVLV
jgi:hypothetical protein